tara:strand:+ start:1028 stop:1513 length:486 start_codon:yes stop_codon:yes gene_type:complete
MKSLGKYTARGVITEELTRAGKPQRVRLFDGSFETGYVVKEFYSIPVDFGDNSSPDTVIKLATSPNIAFDIDNFCNPDDAREIAWAGTSGSSGGGWFDQVDVIDPDNLIIEDLWVYGSMIGADANKIGYLIVLEKFEFSETKGAITMQKDRAIDSEAEWTA